MFAYVGLIVTIISWAAAAVLLRRWGSPDHKSLSEHGADNRVAYSIFAGTLSFTAVAMYWWFGYWLAPKLGLGTSFLLVVSTTIAALLAAGLVPDIPGRRRRIHRFLAYTMAVLFLPLGYLVTTAPRLSPVAHIFTVVLLAYMAASFITVVIFRMFWDRFLLFQGLYILALQLLILAAAYL